MQQTRVIAPMGKAFVAIATIEAFTWAGLLIGMYLKYGSGTTDAGVWLFGRLHGLAFITYIVIAVMAYGVWFMARCPSRPPAVVTDATASPRGTGPARSSRA